MLSNHLIYADYSLPCLDWEERLRHICINYLEHGGKVFTARYSKVFWALTFKVLMTRSSKDFRARSTVFDVVTLIRDFDFIDWIQDCLFRSSEPWVVDELSSFKICLIGTVARVDAVFRGRIKLELASYRSPAFLNRASFADNLFETTFGTASIHSHFLTLEKNEKYGFLSLLCRAGSISMLKHFIDIGVDVNGGEWRNLLGNAAAAGNMDVVCMLFEAGANSSLAFYCFLNHSTELPNELFRHLLGMLVENAGPISLDPSEDPVLKILESSRALFLHPKAAEILLNKKIFNDSCFGRGAYQGYYDHSYMCQAISRRNASVVDLLLQHGAHAEAQISNLFKCYDFWFKSCTWMTFSVMLGAAACADVLVRYGADVTALDGAGRSAVQLAKINALASHPRLLDWVFNTGPGHSITVEEDAETLAVVERAFNERFQGTKSLEDHIESIESTNEVILQSPPRHHRPMSTFRKMSEKALGILFTPTQTELLRDRLRVLSFDIREIWSLSFYEALLMRFVYILSYTLLLISEIRTFIRGHKRIPTPSRFLLSAVALLLLALVWGSSQMGLSWGFYHRLIQS